MPRIFKILNFLFVFTELALLIFIFDVQAPWQQAYMEKSGHKTVIIEIA